MESNDQSSQVLESIYHWDCQAYVRIDCYETYMLEPNKNIQTKETLQSKQKMDQFWGNPVDMLEPNNTFVETLQPHTDLLHHNVATNWMY
jgi:hypothetical protein